MEVTRIFCEENNLSEKIATPIVGKVYESMKSIYGVYNCLVNDSDVNYLNSLNILDKSSKNEKTNDKGIIETEDDNLNISSISTFTCDEDYLEFNLKEAEESSNIFSKLNNSF